MSDKKGNQKNQLSSPGKKVASAVRGSSVDSNALPGYFPPTSPSVLADGPDDFTHIFHQPSVFPTPDDPKPRKTVSATSTSSMRKKPVVSRSLSPAKPAVKQVPASSTSRASSVVKPVKLISTVNKSTTNKPPVAPVSAAVLRSRRRGPFDSKFYLEAAFGPRFTGHALVSDPWTQRKIRVRRPLGHKSPARN